VPHRGKRNESFFIIDIAKKLAELKGVGIAKVAEITTENSRKIFSI
jgi:TatD DNase family protein